MALAVALLVQAHVVATEWAGPSGPLITISPSDATNRPWLGLGFNWGAYDNGTTLPGDAVNQPTWTPYNLTPAQWTATHRRLDFAAPGFMRIDAISVWFCANPCASNGFQYTFDSPMMKNLLQVLDDARERGTPIALGLFDANQWASPTLVGDPDFAKMIADFFQFLVVQRGYSNVSWFNGVNELNDYRFTPPQVDGFLHNVRAALDARGMTGVGIAGPDTAQFGTPCSTGTDNCLGWMENADPTGYYPATAQRTGHIGEIALWDTHWYPSRAQVDSGAVETELAEALRERDQYVPASVPFALTETGTYITNVPDDVYDLNNTSGHRSEDGLSVVDMAVQMARSGTSGAALWCTDSLNYGFDCGMWNMATDPAPRPRYYGWSLLSRFLPAQSQIFRPADAGTGLRLVAARTEAGGWTLVAVNRSSSPVTASLSYPVGQTGGPSQSELTAQLSWAHYSFAPMTGRAVGADDDFLPLPSSYTKGSLAGGVPLTVPSQGMAVVTTLAGASATDNGLQLAVSNTPGAVHPVSVRAEVSQTQYGVLPGDRLEYDVTVDPPTPGAGGMDVVATDGTKLSAVPESAVTGNAAAPDLSAGGVGRMHESIVFPPSLVDHVAASWQLAGETRSSGAGYTATYSNIVVKDAAGRIKLVVYGSGTPRSGQATATGAIATLATVNPPAGMGLQVINGQDAGVARSGSVTLAAPGQVVHRGDVLEYDVELVPEDPPRSGNATADDTAGNVPGNSFCPAVCPLAPAPAVPDPQVAAARAGGLDVETNRLGSFAAAGAGDQYGTVSDPTTLFVHSQGTWVHRRITVPAALDGATVTSLTLIADDPAPGIRYDVVYDDIVLRDSAERLVATLFGGGYADVLGGTNSGCDVSAFPRGIPISTYGDANGTM